MNILPPAMSIFLNFVSSIGIMERPVKKRFWPALIVFLAVLGWATAAAQAAGFTASLDRDTNALGETPTLSLTFEGAQPQKAPSPSVPGLQIPYVGPSSQFSFINGETRSTITYNFTLTPRQTGDFDIPSLGADVGGQRLTSQPLKLKVLPPDSPPPQAVNSGAQVAFMKLALAKDKIYVGEVITAQLELYFRQDVQNYGNFQINPMPADGLTTGRMVEGQHRRVQIGNTVYTVVPALFTLTARKAGPVSIGPANGSVVVVLPSSNPQRDPFFEQFGIRSPMFGGTEQQQVPLATDKLDLESLPLPAGNA